MIVRPIVCTLVLFTLACGAPAGAGWEGTGSHEVSVAESTPFSRGDRVTAATSCVPGESRTCRIYWKDVVGGLHCTESAQHCRADGSAWLRCGHPPEATGAAAAAADLEDDEDDEGPIVR